MMHFFNTDIAAVAGLEEAILLQNIYFWCQKNLANSRLKNGKPFVYNSVKAFNLLHPYMSPSTISRALKNLEANGFIETGEFNQNAYDHTKWYCTTEKTNLFYEPVKQENGSCKSTDFDSQITNSICHFDKSNEEIDESNDEKNEMNKADIDTDTEPFKNTHTARAEGADVCAPASSMPNDSEAQGVSDQHRHYARLVFDVWEKADLPRPKTGFITFLSRDFRLALGELHRQHLHSDDVIRACENYAAVVQLGRQGRSWWRSKSTFDHFARPDIIRRFLPDYFILEEYTDRGKKTGSAVSNSYEHENVEIDF